MARATRSSVAVADNKEQPSLEDVAAAVAAKKRKRRSTSIDDEHASKHSRTDGPPSSSPPPDAPQLKSVADMPLTTAYSSKILEILDVSDKQGLLDRVFPLASTHPQSSKPTSQSLRTLLENAPDHPLSVLKSAVQNLYPVSSHSRTRPSSPAFQQHQFCQLALSLLEEASFHTVQLPLERTSIFPQDENVSTEETPMASTSYSAPHPPRKYALVQHLPQGDYWTSLDTPLPPHFANDPNSQDFRDLSTGHAELVAIFPHPQPPSVKMPTLGSYHKPLTHKRLPSQKDRMVPIGSFLDYGPWASFAPIFEQEYADLGHVQLGQYRYSQEMATRKAAEKRQRMLRAAANRMENDQPMASLQDDSSPSQSPSIDLEGILSPEDVESLKAMLQDGELLRSVEELLERNRKALLRLEELQAIRLNGGSASTVLDQDSDEWETAQSIVDSLTLLASLRPRTSDDQRPSSLVPSPAALHTLQRTLPLQEKPGWQGNLPATQATALWDDSTIKLLAGVPAPTPSVPVITTPVSTVPVTPSSANPATSFASYNYNYAQSQQQYRPAAANQASTSNFASAYRPASTTPYFAQYPQAAGTQNSYYGQQPYHAYSAWFSTSFSGASNPNSGPGTPQPGAGTALASHYQYYGQQAAAAAAATSASGAVQQNRTPAVANTVKQPQWVAPTTPMQYAPMRAGQTNYQSQPQTQATQATR